MYQHKKIFTDTVIKLILPFALLIFLLALAILFVFLPIAREHAISYHKESLKDLTRIGWSTLDYYKSLQESGKLSKEDAKKSAIALLRNMRYGKEKKCYFWIIDMRGTTLMHPYNRKDEGVNIADLTDIDGRHFIKEFIETAQKQKEGFVEYKWQVNDKSDTISTKISHIRLFAPWGWIIGTGVYQEEIEIGLLPFIWPVIIIVCIIIGIAAVFYFFILKRFVSSESKKQTSFEKILMQESKMKALLQAIPDMILRVDRDGVVLDVKDPIGFEPFVNPSDILDKKIIDAWPKNLAEKLIASMERVFVTGEHQELIFEIITASSDHLHIEAHFVLSDGDEILATFRDITNRKR